MWERCTREEHPAFHRYGGRGISIYERWKDFCSFLTDMGERPAGTTLDRIDNERGYEPGNCRWATSEQQHNNYSRNHVLTVAGEALTIAQWARRTGLGKATIRLRLLRGWSAERAVTTAIGRAS